MVLRADRQPLTYNTSLDSPGVFESVFGQLDWHDT
jgi:hypothetical protein